MNDKRLLTRRLLRALALVHALHVPGFLTAAAVIYAKLEHAPGMGELMMLLIYAVYSVVSAAVSGFAAFYLRRASRRNPTPVFRACLAGVLCTYWSLQAVSSLWTVLR